MKTAEKLTHSQIIKMTPSAGYNLRKIAYIKRLSVNNMLNKLITDFIQKNQDLIQKYNEFFNEG